MIRAYLSLSLVAVLWVTSTAAARPLFGRNCLDCHTTGAPPVPNPIDVVGFGAWADPDESGTGAIDRGTLKVFDVVPGGTVDLQVTIDLDAMIGALFAVELKRMEEPGVVSGGILSEWDGGSSSMIDYYTADVDWFRQEGFVGGGDPTRPYYTSMFDSGVSYSVPETFTFTMGIDASVAPDYYDLEFALAGQPNYFYADEHFYLRVIPEPATLASALLGLGLVLQRRRRRCPR